MKKRYLIYLLTLIMAFSPAAVFADVEAQAEPGEDVEAEAVLNEDAEDAAVVEEPVSEEVQEEAQAETQDEEADLVPEAEAFEAVEETVNAEAVNAYAGNDECFWVEGSGRTKAVDKDGNPVYGLFKAQRVAGKLGLYYADEKTGTVVAVEGLVTPQEGNQFTYTSIDGETGWTVTGGGPYTYLIKNHDGDFYITNVLEGLETGAGKTYHVKNGMVDTKTGPFDYDGSKYYIQSDASLQMTAGFTPDHKYFIPAADGKIRTTQGTFSYGGKTYYAGAGGVIPSVAGLYSVGSTQYYVNADGSVKTDAGFITVNGKKYLVNAGGAISKTAGPVIYGGSRYVALSDGSICTTPGFVNAGGARYYVSNSAGVLAVNKSFKVGSNLYHALADGKIGVGVHKWGKYYYYGDANGAIRTKKGIVSWAGNKYYVKKGGKITTNKKVKYKGKSYIAKTNGAFYKGIFTWKKNMYYASAKGVLRTKAGVFTYNGSKYCSKKGGKLYRNKLFTSKGKKYLAQSNGTLKAGSFTWKGKKYLTDSKCAVITKVGLYTYSGQQYYVKKGGPLAVSEFVTYKDNHYYAGSDGAIVKKKFTYKGVTITPNSKTGVISLEEYWKVFPDEAPQASGN